MIRDISMSNTVTKSTIMKKITYVESLDKSTFQERKDEVFSKDIEDPMEKFTENINISEKTLLFGTRAPQTKNENLEEGKRETIQDSKQSSKELSSPFLPETSQVDDVRLSFLQKQTNFSVAVEKNHISGPLPFYVSKVEKPMERVLKRSLYCDVCGLYVNSENQMKQHISSLRHKNVLQGIPIPPKPDREDKTKLRAQQYHCSICKLTLNSEIQLSQHLLSQKHKNMLEGKPPKPRWSPYERIGQARMKTTPRTLSPYNVISNQSFPEPLLLSAATNHLANTNAIPGTNAFLSVPRHLPLGLNYTPGTGHLKPAAFVLQDASLTHTGEIIFFSVPPLHTMPAGATYCSSRSFLQGLPNSQQPLSCAKSLQPILKM